MKLYILCIHVKYERQIKGVHKVFTKWNIHITHTYQIAEIKTVMIVFISSFNKGKKWVLHRRGASHENNYIVGRGNIPPDTPKQAGIHMTKNNGHPSLNIYWVRKIK